MSSTHLLINNMSCLADFSSHGTVLPRPRAHTKGGGNPKLQIERNRTLPRSGSPFYSDISGADVDFPHQQKTDSAEPLKALQKQYDELSVKYNTLAGETSDKKKD